MPHPAFATLVNDGWEVTSDEPDDGSVVIDPDGELWNRDDGAPTAGPWLDATPYVKSPRFRLVGANWSDIVGDGVIVVRHGWAS